MQKETKIIQKLTCEYTRVYESEMTVNVNMTWLTVIVAECDVVEMNDVVMNVNDVVMNVNDVVMNVNENVTTWYDVTCGMTMSEWTM